MTYIYRIGILIAVFVLGFFIGRCTNNETIKIEYVKGETIHDTIVINEPTFVEIPVKPKYIYKYDTIVVDNIQYISEIVDTSAIIQDYILTRTYEFNVFDSETLGRFDVKQQIGYNKLLSFDYSFTPIQKVITKRTKPLFEPFVSVGYNTYQQASVGGGLFYRNVGVEYNYLYSADYNSGHQLGIKVKF